MASGATPDEIIGLIDRISEQADEVSIEQACYQLARVVSEHENEIGKERCRDLILVAAGLWKTAKDSGESDITVHHTSSKH